MRITVPRLVGLGLLICFLGGQAERLVKVNPGSILTDLGIIGDALAVLIIAGLFLLITYLRTGHPLPGHAIPPPEPEPERIPGPTEYSAEVVKLGDGVMAGPAIALIEPDNDDEIESLPGAGELQSAHIELTGKGTGGT